VSVNRAARLLKINPDPIKVVPAAVRDVWEPTPEHRCYHEDGRGRCRRYDTKPIKVEVTREGHSSMVGVEWYCPNHEATR